MHYGAMTMASSRGPIRLTGHLVLRRPPGPNTTWAIDDVYLAYAFQPTASNTHIVLLALCRTAPLRMGE